jgi:hypothetical protein
MLLRRAIRLARLCMVPVVLAVVALGIGRSVRCPVDLADRAMNDEWLAELRFTRCSAIDGTAEIVAVRRRDKAEYSVATFNELSDISLALDGNNNLLVKMPNMIDIAAWREKVEDISVAYRYLPVDDPEERAMYQLWMRHPTDARAKAWCEKYINASIGHGSCS